MRTLILDIETAPNLAAVWGLWDQNVSLSQLLDSSYVLCWSAKWYGKKGVLHSSVYENGEEEMLQEMHDLLSEADAVVHFNGTKFDIPTLNKEFVLHDLPPPSPFKQIDLLKTVRKQFRFPSNKLDYIVKALGIGAKIEHKGHELFIKCMMEEDAKSWALMKKYNKNDVIITEQLYEALLPWIHNHPNVGMYVDSDKPVCSTCGGTHLQYRGTTVTKTQEYRRIQCQECNTWLREIVSVKKPERRGRLVVRES